VEPDRALPDPADDQVEVVAVVDGTDLRQRASAGVVVMVTRSLVVLLVGFGGTVIVARLLTPADLGVVAVGMAFVVFTGLVSDGGLGAGLIRRDTAPSRRELRALSGLQLGITTAATLATVAVAALAPLGRTGWVTAVMVASMPIVALQFPGRILLERSLLYHRLARVELVQVFSYHTWNVVTVLLGWGVWGLATGAVVRALVATVLMAVVMPAGNVRPLLDLATIRPLLSFGLRFQAVSATYLLRDQALNLAVGAVAGVASLGQWSLTRRVMDVPHLLFYSLDRVALPAVPQFLAAGSAPKRLVERAVALTAVGAGFLLTALAGGAPGLVPGLFGTHWTGVSGAVACSCLGLFLTGSVRPVQSFLYAIGDASAVLRAQILQVPFWFAVGLPLLPVLGVAALGLGWAAGATVEVVVLVHKTRKRVLVHLLPALLVPLAVGTVASAGGWLLSVELGRSLWAGLAGGALAAAVFGIGMSLFRRTALLDAASLGAQSVRSALRRGRRRPVAEATGGDVGQR
jgi:O-antigen/teichoic acid export membrane protein